MEPNGSGIAPRGSFAVARYWTSGTPWSTLGPFAHLRYGDGSAQADQWVHAIAEDLRAGKVQEVIARLKRLRPKTVELRESLAGLIRYYSQNAGRMRYDEYSGWVMASAAARWKARTSR